MAFPRPSTADIDAAATHFGFHLGDAERAEFATIAGYTLGAYDHVDALYDEVARPQMIERAYRFPEPADNPLGAWYVTADISSAAHGPLSGKRVAIKDNIAVAGIPMMNGSATLEGFIPSRDATVVERLLGAGAIIAGKSVCEDLCCSSSSFTSACGPVRNPWDPARETGGSSSGSAALVAAGMVDLALGSDQGGSVRDPRGAVRDRRTQADVRAGALHRRLSDRANDRPHRPDDTNGRRRGDDAHRAGRFRRPGSAPADRRARNRLSSGAHRRCRGSASGPAL